MNARRVAPLFTALAMALLLPQRICAQQAPPAQQNAAERLKAEKDALEKIRIERADLQRRMRELQSTVHDLAEERTNIERQADATNQQDLGLLMAGVTDHAA